MDADKGTERDQLESFEMWFCMAGNDGQLDAERQRLSNEEVLKKIGEDRSMLQTIYLKKHRWVGHLLRHGGLLRVY